MDNMENETLEEYVEETISSVEEWEDITLESHEDSFAMGDGEEVYVEENSVSGEEYNDNVQEYVNYGFVPAQDETIETIDGFEVKQIKSTFDRSRISDIKNLWKVSINNTEYDVLFNNTEDLKVIDGYLVNTGANNITGVVVPSSGLEMNTFNEYFVTIMPIATNSAQTSAYRYGSHSYLTRYYYTGTNTLSTDVSYYDVYNVKRPFGSQISFDSLMLCGIMLLLVLVNFIGSIIRR